MRQLHLEKSNGGLQGMVGKWLKKGQETTIILKMRVTCFFIYFNFKIIKV